MFVCVLPNGEVCWNTLKFWRKDSVKEFLGNMTWKEAYKYGSRCKKVNVTFEFEEK